MMKEILLLLILIINTLKINAQEIQNIIGEWNGFKGQSVKVRLPINELGLTNKKEVFKIKITEINGDKIKGIQSLNGRFLYPPIELNGTWKKTNDTIKVILYEPGDKYLYHMKKYNYNGVYELIIVENKMHGVWVEYEKTEKRPTKFPKKINVAKPISLVNNNIRVVKKPIVVNHTEQTVPIEIITQTKEDVNTSLKKLVSSQNEVNYWVKSNNNDFIFAIDKIQNDSLHMNYYGNLYSGKILHSPKYISAEMGGIGRERIIVLTFYTDERKGTGTIQSIGTNSGTAKPIELFDNKFKFIINDWVADNKKYINKKFIITKITPDSLFVNFGSLLYSGKIGRASRSIQVKLYEIENAKTPTIMTIYTNEQIGTSYNSKGYISIKESAYKRTYYILESVRKKELEKNKIVTEKLATKRAEKKEKERFDKIELQRKRSLLTKNEINRVQTNLLKLSTITDELIGKYKEIKRYGRFATHSTIKSYNLYYSKWITLYNSEQTEKRLDHMTENQELGLIILEQILLKHKLDSNFKKILDSNY